LDLKDTLIHHFKINSNYLNSFKEKFKQKVNPNKDLSNCLLNTKNKVVVPS